MRRRREGGRGSAGGMDRGEGRSAEDGVNGERERGGGGGGGGVGGEGGGVGRRRIKGVCSEDPDSDSCNPLQIRAYQGGGGGGGGLIRRRSR